MYVHNHGVMRMVLCDLRFLKHLLIHIVHAILLHDIVDMFSELTWVSCVMSCCFVSQERLWFDSSLAYY